MHIAVRDPQDLAELDRRIAAAREAKQRDRYRAVRLALEGQPCPVIMDKLARSKDFVQRWSYAYRDGGLAALHPKKQPGRPPRLTAAQQAQLKARLDAGPRPGDGVCTLRGKDVRRILAEEFGQPYTLDGAYDLLHRLGYRSLRPRHRKSDPHDQQQFMEHAPLLSKT
jgi:transposase